MSTPMIGQMLGHYRIVKKIASGGMGDVFLADDTSLERQVALKMLPPGLAADAGGRARLAREAKAIAALNHPNIVTVYSVESDGVIDFITMELVQGRMLGALLPRDGFTLDRFFAIAIPLVDAVAAAHRQGIMHRDLKPGNVMLSDEGRVKVLDFGLARAPRPLADGAADTITASPTLVGQVVGTPAYMSPEQAEGRDVDTRSDLFSLGVLFYEMLTGRRPFGGQTPTATIAAIVKDAPQPVAELNTAIPRDLARAVHRCLAKNPIDRYQTAIDLRHDLEDAKQEWTLAAKAGGASATANRGLRSRIGVARTAGAALAAIALLMAGSTLERFRARSTGNATITPRPAMTMRITSSLLAESYPAWSPDGQRLAFQSNDSSYGTVGNVDIWVAQVGSGDPLNLTKGSLANDRRPSWSPDGREIAFYSDRDGEWGVYLVSAMGGSPRKLLSVTVGASTSAPQWSTDGKTLFIAAREKDRNTILQLSLASSQVTRLPLPVHDSPQAWDVSVRPDARRFAYVEAGGGNPEVGRLWTIATSGGDAVPLTDGRHKVGNPTWSADGTQLFYLTNRGGTMDLWQQFVDAGGHATSEPHPITSGLGITSAAFSRDGTKLAFARAERSSNVWRAPVFPDRPATWSDASRVTSESSYIEFVDVSPDGQMLALSSDRRGNQDLWLMSATGGEMTQIGEKIGAYEVIAKLGDGGMGEVYRARDSRLKRDVALKLLPASYASDPDRLARFQREAEVLASLNHPHIAHLYGIEHAPADQHAAALEVAHDQGIIHRDLKPANIKLRSDGTPTGTRMSALKPSRKEIHCHRDLTLTPDRKRPSLRSQAHRHVTVAGGVENAEAPARAGWRDARTGTARGRVLGHAVGAERPGSRNR